MYPPPRKMAKYHSKQVSRYDKVASSQKNLKLAKVNPKTFESSEHSAIIKDPTQAFSLGKTGEPSSVLWLNGDIAKVLISNLYQLGPDDTVERVLAHIMKYKEQTDIPFPEEIYLDTGNGDKTAGNIRAIMGFSGKLVEGINELHRTNYHYEVENSGERYVKLKLQDIRLEQIFKVRNVIVAGETHKDPQTAEMEKNLLPTLKLGVSYENDTIQATGRNVMPDPPAYRMLYFVEDFYEQLRGRRFNHNNPVSRQRYDNLMNKSYERYLGEFNNYTDTVIAKSLADLNLPLTVDRLEELKTILYDTLVLIDDRGGDANVYGEKLIENNARQLIDFFDDLKRTFKHPREEPVMRKLRSTMMYQALKADLEVAGKVVYKVGNNHIKDIRDQFGNPAWVIDEAQYKGIKFER